VRDGGLFERGKEIMQVERECLRVREGGREKPRVGVERE
jgi:hypothetical protein